jgi:hypothetical protein
MNLGQYHRRPLNHGLLSNFQFTESPDPSLQSIHQVLSFDGLPRTQSDQNFMTSPSSTSNVVTGSYNLTNQMSMSHASLLWTDPNQLSSNFEDQSSNDYYHYSPNITDNAPDGTFIRGMSFEIPRFMPDDIGVHSENHMSLDGYESSVYMTAPNKPDPQFPSSARSTMAYNTVDNPRDFPPLSISTSTSPKMERDLAGSGMLFGRPSPFRLPSSETSEDGGNSSREMTAIEGDEPAADEPYAKLIYRALMSAPNHSMVLQEIYQWFRENTVKGSSDTKGWMNSIRHNLSMNAVGLFPKMSFVSAMLTIARLSRKPSERFLATRPRSQLHGS